MPYRKDNRGGARPGAGRKRNKYPLKNFSVRTDVPTHAKIKRAADKALKSVSAFCLDATLEKIDNAPEGK